MKSWKTTLAAIGLFISVLIGQLSSLWDADPATIPDWDLVITQLIAAIGFLFARDNIEAEDVKPKNPAPTKQP